MPAVPSADYLAALMARVALSPQEAATVTGLSLSSVRRAIASGDLPARKLGRRVLIPTEAVRALVGDEAA